MKMNWFSNALTTISDFIMDNIVDPIVDLFSSAPPVEVPSAPPVEMATAPSTANIPQTSQQPKVTSAPMQNDVEKAVPNQPIEEPDLPKRAKSKKTKTEKSKQTADVKAPEKKNDCASEEECEKCKKTWDKHTNRRIEKLHPKIKCKSYDFINKVEKKLGIKLRVVQGLRTFSEQNALYAKGRTVPGKKVTWVKGGYSFHNYGLAIDVVEIKNGKANWNTKWKQIAVIGKSFGFIWGGDWEKTPDKPHFQMTFGYSTKSLIKKNKVNGYVKI